MKNDMRISKKMSKNKKKIQIRAMPTKPVNKRI